MYYLLNPISALSTNQVLTQDLALAGQEFVKVGLQNCHINSSLPVGKVLQISFLVWDNGRPPLTNTVSRTLVIIAPCASGMLLC